MITLRDCSIKSKHRIEIICTGDEVLSGKTQNTNYSHLARRLDEAGLPVSRGTTVGDDRNSLATAFLEAADRAALVIVNGGLGPTVDDLSQEVAADVAGVELELREDWLSRIQEFYRRRGREMPANNRKQALLPAGAELIDNPGGTACGFALSIKGARFFFTPGVPRELKQMFENEILPRLLVLSGRNRVTRLKRFHTFGIGESRADLLLQGVTGNSVHVKLGFQAHYPQLETKLAVEAASKADVGRYLAPVEAAVRQRLGNFIVAEDAGTLEQGILDTLRACGGSLATAEMFTGGGLIARLMPLTGSEGIIRRGVVSRDLSQLLDAAGAAGTKAAASISPETAVALAAGLRQRSDATHGLIVLIDLRESPGGNPLTGNIVIAIASDARTASRCARFSGSGDWIRLGAIEMGLDCLRRFFHDLPLAEKIDFEDHD